MVKSRSTSFANPVISCSDCGIGKSFWRANLDMKPYEHIKSYEKMTNCEKKVILYLYDENKLVARKRIKDKDFKELIALYPEEAKRIDSKRYEQLAVDEQQNKD